ncbi:MAG: YbjN domain-containing protein [Alphaproteobacteria bacterium]|nr:YbjN domain-containing protein [Alphaproteobacteria bacterium]
MTTLSTGHSEVISQNPVDLAEELAGANDWAVERHGEDELTMFISGQYTDLQFRVFWRDDFKTLQFACLFDLKVPEGRRADIYQTLGLINERMWIGHFEYWAEEDALLFRHASLVGDPLLGAICEEHMVTMVETALGECERFYPVFQFVMWGGQSPEEAIESAMLECAGSA